MQVVKDRTINKLGTKKICDYCFNESDYKITIHTIIIHLCEQCKHELTFELVSN